MSFFAGFYCWGFLGGFTQKTRWVFLGIYPGVWTLPPIISGTRKATGFKFGQYIQRVHPNKSPWKILEKRNRGRIHGLPNFLGTPYYLRNGKSYGLEIWPVHSEGPSEEKPVKSLEKMERGRMQGLPNFIGYPPIISGTGKATDFKFCMHMLNRTKAH